MYNTKNSYLIMTIRPLGKALGTGWDKMELVSQNLHGIIYVEVLPSCSNDNRFSQSSDYYQLEE